MRPQVQAQRTLDANAKQFASWRTERERELAALRKQTRRDRAQIQHLEALQVCAPVRQACMHARTSHMHAGGWWPALSLILPQPCGRAQLLPPVPVLARPSFGAAKSVLSC